MISRSASPSPAGVRSLSLWILPVALLVVVGFLFRESFDPDMAAFANDGPLGLMMASCSRLPWTWLGAWSDLNWLGLNAGSTPPDITAVVAWVLGPLGYIKYQPVVSVTILGLCAGFFFRRLGFHPVACVLGGLAAGLNSDFFSYACWGLGTLTLCVGAVFVALGALVSGARPAWARPVLAGVALGVALMEGFDNGAIFSLYIAAFAMFQAWNQPEGEAAVPLLRRLSLGAVKTGVVAVVSGLVAAHMLIGLIQLNITGVVGMSQDRESRAMRWSEATQWSLPPKEALRSVIPGLYGYRMDTPGGGQYWGLVGSHPEWDRYLSESRPDPAKAPRQIARFSGAGHYAGVLVVLLGVFGVAQSLRREGGGLSMTERRWVRFWTVAAVLSLLFAFGRFVPFYSIIYALPYFSTIRNPVKFLHSLNLSLVILAAYGVQALWRGWVLRAAPRPIGPAGAIRSVLARKGSWESRWVIFTFVAVAVAWLAWLTYGSAKGSLIQHLGLVGFSPEDAKPIAAHSVAEVGIFAMFLTFSVVLVASLLGGVAAGSRANQGAFALGLILCFDLARANAPWVQHYNWRERYATNPIFDTLRQTSHEARVTGQMPFAVQGQAGRLQASLASVYGGEWAQHQLRYFDIQTLDVVQMPRVPADRMAYLQALHANPVREWELGNVRWMLTLAPLVDAMNDQLDGGRKRFRVHTSFNLSQTSSGVIKVETNATGPFGLLEFKGALPRALLYDRWRSDVADEECLGQLASTNFNPHAEVLVSQAIPATAVDTATQPAGTTTFVSYASKRIVLATEARTPCVLLLNDRYEPDWHVYVDGREDTLLRANYLMRGVYLKPGKHEVEFRFEPPITTLWISLAALASGLGLCVWVVRASWVSGGRTA